MCISDDASSILAAANGFVVLSGDSGDTWTDVSPTEETDEVLVSHPAIDQYGDWTVELPQPVGDATYAIRATCGSVVYDQLEASTTSTSTTSTSTSTSTTTTTPGRTPPPARPVRTRAAFTG